MSAIPTVWCRSVLCSLSIMACVACGCGQARYPVHGTVSYGDGTPFSGGGFVVMEGEVDGKPVMARGAIQPDGTFTLNSRYAGSGVLAGEYRMRLVPPDGAVDQAAPSKPPFDAKFLTFETSGVTCRVDDAAADVAITLGPRP